MNPFSDLPPEIVLNILSQLDRKEAFKLKPVCKRWNALLTSNSHLFPKIPTQLLQITKKNSIKNEKKIVYREAPATQTRKRKIAHISTAKEASICPSECFFSHLRQCLENYSIRIVSFDEVSLDSLYLKKLSQAFHGYYVDTLTLDMVDLGRIQTADFHGFLKTLNVRRLSLNWLRDATDDLLNAEFFANVVERIKSLQIGYVNYKNSKRVFTIGENAIEGIVRTPKFEFEVAVDKDNAGIIKETFKVLDRLPNTDIHFSTINFTAAETDLAKCHRPKSCRSKVKIYCEYRNSHFDVRYKRYRLVPNKKFH